MSDEPGAHARLRHLGGRLPDAVLAGARLELADSGTVTVPDPDDLIDLGFSFRPALDDSPPLLDLTGRDPGDEFDRVAVRAAAGLPEAVALWRAWRFAPEFAGDSIPPARVYVLEANGPQARTTAAVMRELAAAGLASPQVEVYRSGEELPAYSHRARDNSALLWVGFDAPPLRMARALAPGRTRLAGADRAQVASYLDGGETVMSTTEPATDDVEPERGAVVPMGYRTDGRWIWPESVLYYLLTYDLAPEEGLLAHARAAGPLLPAPDPADVHRALALLFVQVLGTGEPG